MFGGIGTTEMVAFGVLALMLFGSKLPEVAKNLGGTYRQLKRNVDDFKREFHAVDTYEPPKIQPKSDLDEPQIVETSAPKFEIPKDDQA
jgi:sec-independent protein translocase protein TatA